MTKQQFLDAIQSLAATQGNPFCYSEKVRNDAYEQAHGTRVPSWDVKFFYCIECVTKEQSRPLVWGDWVYNSHRTQERYNIARPASGTYSDYLADLNTQYTAGETGIEITNASTGNTAFVAYADMSSITCGYIQSPEHGHFKAPSIGLRQYWGLGHVGFLRVTPRVIEMDLTQAVWLNIYGRGEII